MFLIYLFFILFINQHKRIKSTIHLNYNYNIFDLVENKNLFIKNEHYFVKDEHHFIKDEYYIINFSELVFIINIVNENIVYRKLIIHSIKYSSFEIIVNNLFLMCSKFI